MNPSDAVHPLVRTAHAGRRPVTSRAQISTVAIDLFTARGFEETSVDDVADAVGIAR
ncbi:TetR family transcriptional regulator, partial [Streptomyces sp. SID10244]|nr:TetR family transcriptional regulator [Streptomyces sp. SID10244]